MGIFRKQTTRAPWTTVLLVLLLALSIGASSIGFTAWVGAKRQFAEIDSQYTTIGILSGANWDKQWDGDMFTHIGFDSYEFSDGTTYIGPQTASLIASTSEAYLSHDNGVLLSAHVKDSTAITSGTMDPLRYHSEMDDNCYSLSVFAVRCTAVVEYEHLMDRTGYPRYGVEFEIIDPVCLMDVYDIPPEEDIVPLREDTLWFSGELYDRDGSMPFEVGKTYLIRGMYGDYPIGYGGMELVLNEETGKEEQKLLAKRVEALGRSFTFGCDGGLIFSSISNMGVTSGVQNFIKEKLQYPDSELCYWTTPEGCWPYYAEYEGDWRDFLETEEGYVWKEKIIPSFEINHASATVILTNNLYSMYNFNAGDASILEGRAFEKEEYINGDAVCLVSASYAKLNGYHVGDVISLDYYDTDFQREMYGEGILISRTATTVQRFPLTEDTRMDIQKDYTIIGIYTSPEWSAGNHSFHADTIFVPKSSVPGMDTYIGKSMPMLHSIVIKNGSIDAFEAHMAEKGMAGVYLYFDQGYTEAASTVQTLIDNAMRLMLVGTAMFVLASLLFLLLYARRVAAVIRAMRLLGVPRRQTWLECLGMLFTQETTAVLLGNALAVVLYEKITAQLLSSTPALSMESVLLCGGIQLGALLLVGSIWMHTIAGRNLMQNTTVNRKIGKPAACGA